MSIIKGTNQIVAGFGGTKRSIGEVYFSQSALATDNSGALPLFTGETIASANTIYPEFYNWVLAHTELQCTSAEYESALSTYGECAKYVIGGGSLRLPLIKNYIKAANTSDTVTPASTTLYPWVVAYTAAIPASTAQAAEFQNALSGKADVDLSNITSLGKKSSVSWIMPDYSRYVATGLAGSPTSQSTNSYTCPTDGWIMMQASRQVVGNTLHFYVNGEIRLQFPAFSASYGNLMYPVGKGDVISLNTDATSATWVIDWCDFIPCKGA